MPKSNGDGPIVNDRVVNFTGRDDSTSCCFPHPQKLYLFVTIQE